MYLFFFCLFSYGNLRKFFPINKNRCDQYFLHINSSIITLVPRRSDYIITFNTLNKPFDSFIHSIPKKKKKKKNVKKKKKKCYKEIQKKIMKYSHPFRAETGITIQSLWPIKWAFWLNMGFTSRTPILSWRSCLFARTSRGIPFSSSLAIILSIQIKSSVH